MIYAHRPAIFIAKIGEAAASLAFRKFDVSPAI